ncbi:MAG: DUF2304 family protein [Candidatus Magasanikbacteria bacterium]
MFLIQIILILFCLLAVIKVVSRYRGGDITLSWLIFWLIFWMLVGVVAFEPDSTMYFAHLLGVGRGADAVVYLALALLFFLFFKLMVKVERMDKKITKIIRGMALENKKSEVRD